MCEGTQTPKPKLVIRQTPTEVVAIVIGKATFPREPVRVSKGICTSKVVHPT
jgi:hypothetical protein